LARSKALSPAQIADVATSLMTGSSAKKASCFSQSKRKSMVAATDRELNVVTQRE
jgi:hypothetical protein